MTNKFQLAQLLLKTKFPWRDGVIAIGILLFVACGKGTNTGNPARTPDPGSGGGSPTATAAQSLINRVCSQVAQCFGTANESACTLQAMGLAGYTSTLGIPASNYSTMNDLKQAENTSQLVANQGNLQTCLTAISSLSCGGSTMAGSYSVSDPADYSQTNQIFNISAACSQVY